MLVAIGAALYALPFDLPTPDRTDDAQLIERVTEVVVLVSLMGAGLKLDRLLGWRRWATTWRLLGIAMPLTIAGIAVLAALVLDVPAASALLIAAALAPTDPVLASDVQVGEPTLEEDLPPDAEDEVRFALTSEGGLNDGLAFPFVYAAIALADHGDGSWITRWLAIDVAYRVGVAVVVGVVCGWLLARVLFRPPADLTPLAESTGGFVALAATLLTYGVAESIHGYGFLAVFVAAVVLRTSERAHEHHRVLHQFSEEIEQLLTLGVLVLFGGALVSGALDGFTWRVALVAGLTIGLVRPLAAWVSLHGTSATPAERRVIAFFGIRGVGTLYYVSYALTATEFAHADRVWATAVTTILVSVVVHGVAATPVMRLLDRHRDHHARRARTTVNRA